MQKEKQHYMKDQNQYNLMFKVFVNNYKHIHVRYISHDCIFKDINQLVFFFDILCCWEKVCDN